LPCSKAFPHPQDLHRLFPDEEETVTVTLVEAHEILSAFDSKLRSYTEKLINKRKAMHIVQASVTGVSTSTSITLLLSLWPAHSA